jgi:hypothetical protein
MIHNVNVLPSFVFIRSGSIIRDDSHDDNDWLMTNMLPNEIKSGRRVRVYIYVYIYSFIYLFIYLVKQQQLSLLGCYIPSFSCPPA